MKFDELLAKMRAERAALVTEREAQSTIVREVLAACESDGQRNPTAEEATRSETANAERTRIDSEIAALDARLAPFVAEEAAQRADEEAKRHITRTAAADRVEVVREPRTYSRENDPKGLNFMRDVALDFMGSREARERLYQHEREERAERSGNVFERTAAGVTTGTATGLLVPQYLIDMYAPMGRAGRRFADSCRHHDLPPTGMEVYIPFQTAQTSTDEQTTELTAVDETDYDDDMKSVKVRTAAGAQTISRQGVERVAGLEDTIVQDLLRAYNSDLDDKLLNSATWGLDAVATTLTFTDSTPTALKLYKKVQSAAGSIEGVLLDQDEGDVFSLLHGRRWAWLKSETTSDKPFITAGVPQQAVGSDDQASYQAAKRGEWPDGGPIVTDNHISKATGTGTNEDIVYVVARQEAHLWEDPQAPLFIRAEQNQAKKLGIDLVVYGYFAGCFDRVKDGSASVHRKITGTGLVTPVM